MDQGKHEGDTTLLRRMALSKMLEKRIHRVHNLYIFLLLVFIAFRKKAEALAKEKDCEIIGSWLRSMVNNVYWCAASTSEGSGDLIRSKWLSLSNHIHNVHTGRDSLFPNCSHQNLETEREKKWFRPRKG